MSNVIDTPTRVSNTSRTLIDPIATCITNTIQCLHACTFETDKQISDHYGTCIYFKIGALLLLAR